MSVLCEIVGRRFWIKSNFSCVGVIKVQAFTSALNLIMFLFGLLWFYSVINNLRNHTTLQIFTKTIV